MMNFIVKKFMSDEVLTRICVDSHITVADFAEIFRVKFTNKFQCHIEQTKYSVRNNLISSDFKFFYFGGTFKSGDASSQNTKLIDELKIKEIKDTDYVLHVSFNVYHNNYCMNGHLHIKARDEIAAEYFILIVLICDGYLTHVGQESINQLISLLQNMRHILDTKTTLESIPSVQKVLRFFDIATTLPLELQMVLSNRAAGLGKNSVLIKDAEKATNKFLKTRLTS